MDEDRWAKKSGGSQRNWEDDPEAGTTIVQLNQ